MLLTKEQQGYMKMPKSVIFLKGNLKINVSKIKHIVKLKIMLQGNIEVLRKAYVI